MFVKKTANKKKDILWCLFHKALSLEYQLQHISPSISGSCPWCDNELQTAEHFALKCKVSKEIWKQAYGLLKTNQTETPPISMDEIFTATNIINHDSKQATLWLHTNIIYEIWCTYTSFRWGDSNLASRILPLLVIKRLHKNVNALYYILKNCFKKMKNIYKCIQCP